MSSITPLCEYESEDTETDKSDETSNYDSELDEYESEDTASNEPDCSDLSSTDDSDDMKGEFDTTDRLENENLECGQCGKHFKLKRYLDQHISKIHDTNSHPFECTECGSLFKQKCHLKRHKINKHKICDGKYTYPNDETFQTFSCPTCSKSFERKHVFENHLVTHQANKKLSCDNCGKTFGRKDTLAEHIRSQHL